jgi:hypothetical protein
VLCTTKWDIIRRLWAEHTTKPKKT